MSAENFPAELKYTKEHEWTQLNDNQATIGITHHAQDALGEIVFVELPGEDTQLKKGDTFGAVESIKAVSDLYSPLSGKVVEVNSALLDDPSQVNADPYGEAWMVKIELSDPSECDALMDVNSYKELVESL